MKSKTKLGLAGLLLTGSLFLNPIQSYAQEIYGRIGNLFLKNDHTEQGEPIPRIDIKLSDVETNQPIATFFTNEDGEFNHNLNVKGRNPTPKYKLNLEDIKKIQIYNIGGRLEKTHYGNNLNELLRNIPSGIKPYIIEDKYGNKQTGNFVNLEGKILNKLSTKPFQKEDNKNYPRTASSDEIRNVRVVINSTNEDYCSYVDTINVIDGYELNEDLFPNVEIVWPQDMMDEEKPYDNVVDFVKQILKCTDEDVRGLEERDRMWYNLRWLNFPIDAYHNDEGAPNENYRNAVRATAENINDTEYGGYSHSFINLVNRVPESGARYDFSQEGSSFDTILERNEDGFFYIVGGIIYINNNIGNPLNPTIHETENILVKGRDSPNPLDVQHAGGSNELSVNDRYLLIARKNMIPFYLELPHHRPFNENQ